MKGKLAKREQSKAKKEKIVVPISKLACVTIYSAVLFLFLPSIAFDTFSIPSASMESTLTKGDYVICSNLHYGKRIILPLDIPIYYKNDAHNYQRLLPNYWRIFGFGAIKRNDVLVFNFPPDTEHEQIEMKKYFIKRCVALPADTFEIRDRKIYINSIALEEPYQPKFTFIIKTQAYVDEQVFVQFGVREVMKKSYGYMMYATDEQAKKLQTALKSVAFIRSNTHPKGIKGTYIHPPAALFKWNRDNFGKMLIPYQNLTIQVNPENLALYQQIILNYEGLEKIRIVDNRLFINDKEVFEYTFQQNYYFTLGDNRHNSYDSRYWGLVPENHIVGKPIMIAYSYDTEATNASFRWNRMLKWIE
jgi:signal peptidase I